MGHLLFTQIRLLTSRLPELVHGSLVAEHSKAARWSRQELQHLGKQEATHVPVSTVLQHEIHSPSVAVQQHGPYRMGSKTCGNYVARCYAK